jgi:hypothetical protein
MEIWLNTLGSDLEQGDFLPECALPMVGPDFEPTIGESKIVIEVRDLIVITQSCDLANAKVQFAALCPIYGLDHFESINPDFAKRGRWELVRKGRVEGLHLLGSPQDPQNNRLALVVDFREIYSLPVAYLANHAAQQADRWRLQSPYLEHFSQAFARFFMRVGLPVQIPEYK